jgi:hypothetical protein
MLPAMLALPPETMSIKAALFVNGVRGCCGLVSTELYNHPDMSPFTPT